MIDRIVLRVNSRIATQGDYEMRLAERRQSLMSADLDDERKRELLERTGVDVFGDIYEELLILSRADQLDLDIPDSMVAEQVAQTRQQMGLESDEDLARALAQSGLSLDHFEERTRNNLLMQRLMAEEMQARISIEEEDLRRYYRENEEVYSYPEAREVEEVIVLEDAFDDPEALASAAAELAERAKAELDLSVAAAPLIEAGQATSVIDHGWVDRDDLAAALSDAAWELEADQVSAPIDARGGLHVVHVVAVRTAGMRPFEEVKDHVEASLREQKMTTEIPGYMLELERRAYVVTKLPPQAEGFQRLAERDD